jgi:hypothetical protein
VLINLLKDNFKKVLGWDRWIVEAEAVVRKNKY